MNEEPKKYYQLVEITKDDAEQYKNYDITVYKKSRKYYTLSWGHSISTLADDRKTILYNTEIEGVIEAEDDEDAVEKFGLTVY